MNEIFASETFAELLKQLQQFACSDDVTAWPRNQIAAMTAVGVMTWDVPHEWGGLDFQPLDQNEGLRLLATSCLVSTFILTQRSAAVRRIATSENVAAKQKLLPGLLSGEIFATVGISHLTTSGRHLKAPLVAAERSGNGFLLTGTVPWATSATQADHLVTGGTTSDGREILACVPTDRAGLEVKSPVQLMGLNASQTGAVSLQQVRVESDELLHGPVAGVMQQGTGGGAGAIGTSALALGAAEGTLRRFSEEADRRPDLREFVDPLRAECQQLTGDLRLAALGTHPAGEGASTLR